MEPTDESEASAAIPSHGVTIGAEELDMGAMKWRKVRESVIGFDFHRRDECQKPNGRDERRREKKIKMPESQGTNGA